MMDVNTGVPEGVQLVSRRLFFRRKQVVRFRLSTLVSIGATLTVVPVAATAQDRPLTADFPEVYRMGGRRRARMGPVLRSCPGGV